MSVIAIYLIFTGIFFACRRFVYTVIWTVFL